MNQKLLLFILIGMLAFSQIADADNLKSTAEINNMYYDLSKTNFQKFECRVTIDLFEKLKEEVSSNLSKRETKAMDSIKFNFFYKDRVPKFTASKYPEFSDMVINKTVVQTIDGIDDIVTGFFGIWDGICAEPLFNEIEGEKYNLVENENGYTTNFKQDGSDVEFVFDKDYLLQKITCVIGKMVTVLIPKFISTDRGLLISELDINIGNDTMRELVRIEYTEINEIYLPENVNIKMNIFQMDQDINLKFFNYKVKMK